MNNLSWCGGFFDGEGSFTFSAKCPTICINNTNPLAVTQFMESMMEFGINFKITERSKPSKSSKKKRWDLYNYNTDEIKKFINIMDKYIHGKKNQMMLIKSYFEDKKTYSSYEEKIKSYQDMMKFLNQTNNIIILNKDVLIKKIKNLILEPEILIDDNQLYIDTYDNFNDWNYVAGIFDAEGTFYINKRQNKNSNNDRFIPFVSFVNTNKEIIKHVCSVFRNNKIGYHVQARKNEERNRIRWDVSVSGVKRNLEINSILKDKLIIKNKQSELLVKYSNMRLNNYNINDIGHSFKEAIEALNKEN